MCVEFLCMFSPCLCGFPPTIQTHTRQIGYAEMPLGTNVLPCNGLVSHMGWILLPCASVARISSTATLTCIKQLLNMSEWINVGSWIWYHTVLYNNVWWKSALLSTDVKVHVFYKHILDIQRTVCSHSKWRRNEGLIKAQHGKEKKAKNKCQ